MRSGLCKNGSVGMRERTMAADQELLKLAQSIAEIEGRFVGPESSIHSHDEAEFKRIVVEAKSILDSELGHFNDFSRNLFRAEHAGSGTLYGCPSHACVREARAIIEGSVNHIRRRTPIRGRDSLTQLGTREAMDSELSQALVEATSRKCPLSLVMMDIDHFKKVNDTHGHPKGDAVLAETAARIISVAEGKGRAYRYGGEEIAILLPNHNTQEAIAVAERARRTLEDAPIGGLTVTASFGVATSPDHGNASAGIVKAADAALYDAKDRGRNLVRVYGEPPPAQPDKAREPERKPPTPGSLTDEEKDQLRLEYFRTHQILCPKDGAILAVSESHAIGKPTASLLIQCKYCGLVERL